MRSQPILGLSCLLLLCAVVSSQHTYDGRDGPHVFGKPGNQIYIRGNNEGPYQVPGVAGVFENSASKGAHGYNDGQGTTYAHTNNGGRAPSSHSIRGPVLNAQHGPNVAPYPQPAGADPLADPYRRTRSVVVSRPDRVVTAGGGGPIYISRSRRNLHVERPGRTVDLSLPGRDVVVQRHSRSPQDVHVIRSDGREVRYADGVGFAANGYDGRSVVLSRQKRQRVQGDNFVARGDQAGVWNKDVSVWSRPDGRTVTVDRDGNVITSGSPNGRGSQKYSG